MAKFPTTIERNTPRASRGVASYDVGSVRSSMLGAARSTERGLDDLAGGMNVLAAEVERVQVEDDRRYAVELENEFAKRISAIQYGDGTPQNPGYFNLQGEQAVTGYAGTEQSIEKAKQELLLKAKNKRVKEIFGLAATSRQTTEVEQMRKHVGTARLDAANTAAATRYGTAVNDAAAAPGNEEILNRSIAIVENEAIAEGRRNGWNNESIALRIQEKRTEVYTAAIGAAMVADPEAADAIYQKYKGRIAGTARPKIEAALLEQTLDARGQGIAEEAMANAKGEAAQLEYVRKNYSGPQEEKAIAELKERYVEVHSRIERAHSAESRARENIRWQWTQAAHEEQEAIKAAKGAAFEAIEKGQDLTVWASENPEAYATLDINEWNKLEARQLKVKRGLEYADLSDPVVKTELWTMKSGALAQLNPLEYKDKLTEGDYEQFLTRRDAAADRLNKESENRWYYTRMEYMMKDKAPKVGTPGKQKMAVDDAAMEEAKNTAAAEIYAAIQNDVKVDDKFLREQATRLMMPLWKDKWGYDALVGVVGNYDEFSDDDQDALYIPPDKLPPHILEEVKVDLKAAGIEEDDVALGKLGLQLIRALQTGDSAEYIRLLDSLKE